MEASLPMLEWNSNRNFAGCNIDRRAGRSWRNNRLLVFRAHGATGLELGQFLIEQLAEKELPGLLAILGRGRGPSDLGQFPAVQPHAPAIRAFVHQHGFIRAKFVLHHHHLDAAGAGTAVGQYDGLRIERQGEQGCGQRVMRRIDLVNLKMVEPDAAAAAAANIHRQASDL